jgi:hypothetical protein
VTSFRGFVEGRRGWTARQPAISVIPAKAGIHDRVDPRLRGGDNGMLRYTRANPGCERVADEGDRVRGLGDRPWIDGPKDTPRVL